MNKLTAALTFCFLLLMLNGVYAQMDGIKYQIKELFMGFNLSPEKFDIKRTYAKSQNFYGYNEIKVVGLNCISFNFEENDSLNYLSKENNIKLYFKPDGNFDQLVLLIDYSTEEINTCENQINELLTRFKKISYKVQSTVTTSGNNDIIGRGYSFFSSANQFKNRKAFLNVSFTESNVGYTLSVHYHPDKLK